MATNLEIRASEREFKRYRKLVDSEWDGITLDAVLKLAWDVTVGPRPGEYARDELLAFLTASHATGRIGQLPPQFAERFKLLSLIFRGPQVSKLPSKPEAVGAQSIAAQANMAIAYLLMQAEIRIVGEAGFFRDLQSLIYLHSIHYLLPVLQKERLKAWHDYLVNALVIHASIAWRDDPSHMFYLLAAVMGHLGKTDDRLRLLYQSVSVTPVDDHSYLTKASSYWAELLELGERDRAMEFLLRLSRTAPESYLSEIREMITETADFKAAS